METRVGRIAFPVLLTIAFFIFLVDVRLPRGATVAICYVPLVTIAAGYRSRRPLLILATLCSILTIVDVYLSPPNGLPAWVSLNNRGLTLGAMWFIVFLAGTRLREYWIGQNVSSRPFGLSGSGLSFGSGTASGDGTSDASNALNRTGGATAVQASSVGVRSRATVRASTSGGEPFARRIAIIAHTNAPWTTPYAQYFQSCHREVRVISFHPDRVEGVDTVFVGREPFDSTRGKGLFVTRVPEVRRSVEEFAPDVVLGCYLISNGLTAALSWRGPLVVSARGGCVLRQTRSGEAGLPTATRKRMLRFVCSRADRIHAVSAEIAEALEGIGVSRSKIECFPLGVDAAKFLYAARPIRDGEPVHLICTRQQEAVYQNHVVLEAIAELRRRGRNVQCTMVGGGSMLEARRAQARLLGIEKLVQFAGHRPAGAMPALLGTAQLYVSASSSDGTSSSLLEAMAAGLFPIVTDIRANREWIRSGETGLLFEVGNVAQLAAAIESAIDRPAMIAAAGIANRRRIEDEGDRRVMNGRMLELLDRVCAARAGV